MKEKTDTGARLLQRLTDGYLALMLSVYLLWPGLGGYETITEAKFRLFLVLSIAWCGLTALLALELRLTQPRGGKRRDKAAAALRPHEWLLLGYLLCSLIAALASPWRADTWLGLGRHEGLLTLTLYVLIILLAGRFARPAVWMLDVFGVSMSLNCLLAAVQMLGKNPFGLYPAGVTYFDAGTAYTGVYLGTVGNADLLAAVLCSGMTIIENCAKEPHIVDLANFLNAMGAKISGAGTDVIKIRGVERLTGGSYTIIPDQIEAGTYMAAAAAVGGDVTVDNVIPKHLDCITAKLREMGAKVTEYDDSIRVEAERRLRRSNVKTMPYPGFPTDMQPQIAVCMALAEGTSLVTEGIYDNRFRYTAELNRMGASIQVESKTAVIDGVTQLHGCEVRACDLRAGAAMVIAALCAEGTTTIEDAHYIERGYEDIIGKFAAIGGKIRRIETFEGSSQDAAG